MLKTIKFSRGGTAFPGPCKGNFGMESGWMIHETKANDRKTGVLTIFFPVFSQLWGQKEG